MVYGLLDYKTQETFYRRIVERYMTFCSTAGRRDELFQTWTRVDQTVAAARERNQRRFIPNDNSGQDDIHLSPQPQQNGREQAEIGVLILAMRKLREGIIASGRVDDFSIQACIFTIRLTILVKHAESYYPAILHLIYRMHPIQPLTRRDMQEIIGYLVLDLACRQQKLTQAYLIRQKFHLQNSRINTVLRALSHNNYVLFWRVKYAVDGHCAKLMEFAEDGVRRQTLKCIGRSYLKIDVASLEYYTNTTWPSLTQDGGVGWQLQGGTVIIRKSKKG